MRDDLGDHPYDIVDQRWQDNLYGGDGIEEDDDSATLEVGDDGERDPRSVGADAAAVVGDKGPARGEGGGESAARSPPPVAGDEEERRGRQHEHVAPR